MRYNKSTALFEIKLAEGSKVPDRVQVLRVGKFNHPTYGKFEITKKTLAEMKANFDKRVRGIDVAFDYYHESEGDASAWVKGLELSQDGNELWAVNVEWTPKAAQKLSDRELRYFSPDFTFKWVDPESGNTFNNVLFGGGLTNRPFVKEMQPIVMTEKERRLNMNELEQAQADLKQAQGENVKLSEKVTALQTQLSEVEALKTQLAELNGKVESLTKENETLKTDAQKSAEAAKLAEKEKEFNVLLSEGKAVAAQKDAFIKGDMAAFVKLSQPVNLKASGSSSSQAGEEDEDDKILKLAEEKRKADKSLDVATSISLARKEIKNK